MGDSVSTLGDDVSVLPAPKNPQVPLPPMVMFIDAVITNQCTPQNTADVDGILAGDVSGLVAVGFAKKDRASCVSSADGKNIEFTAKSDSFASVSLDGKEVPGGQLQRLPSAPIQVMPRNLGATLRVRFSGIVCSELSVPISTLTGFGAPLYTSIWLGLKHVPSTDCNTVHNDDQILQAVQSARCFDTPKVKVTLFTPALPMDRINECYETAVKALHTSTPRVRTSVEVKSFFDRDWWADNMFTSIEGKVKQVQGLMRCLDESNALVRSLLEDGQDKITSLLLKFDRAQYELLPGYLKEYKIRLDAFQAELERKSAVFPAKLEEVGSVHQRELVFLRKTLENDVAERESELKTVRAQLEKERVARELMQKDLDNHKLQLSNTASVADERLFQLENEARSYQRELEASQHLREELASNRIAYEQERQSWHDDSDNRVHEILKNAELEHLVQSRGLQDCRLQMETLEEEVAHNVEQATKKRLEVLALQEDAYEKCENVARERAEDRHTQKRNLSALQDTIASERRSHARETESLTLALESERHVHRQLDQQVSELLSALRNERASHTLEFEKYQKTHERERKCLQEASAKDHEQHIGSLHATLKAQEVRAQAFQENLLSQENAVSSMQEQLELRSVETSEANAAQSRKEKLFIEELSQLESLLSEANQRNIHMQEEMRQAYEQQIKALHTTAQAHEDRARSLQGSLCAQERTAASMQEKLELRSAEMSKANAAQSTQEQLFMEEFSHLERVQSEANQRHREIQDELQHAYEQQNDLLHAKVYVHEGRVQSFQENLCAQEKTAAFMQEKLEIKSLEISEANETQSMKGQLFAEELSHLESALDEADQRNAHLQEMQQTCEQEIKSLHATVQAYEDRAQSFERNLCVQEKAAASMREKLELTSVEISEANEEQSTKEHFFMEEFSQLERMQSEYTQRHIHLQEEMQQPAKSGDLVLRSHPPRISLKLPEATFNTFQKELRKRTGSIQEDRVNKLNTRLELLQSEVDTLRQANCEEIRNGQQKAEELAVAHGAVEHHAKQVELLKAEAFALERQTHDATFEARVCAARHLADVKHELQDQCRNTLEESSKQVDVLCAQVDSLQSELGRLHDAKLEEMSLWQIEAQHRLAEEHYAEAQARLARRCKAEAFEFELQARGMAHRTSRQLEDLTQELQEQYENMLWEKSERVNQLIGEVDFLQNELDILQEARRDDESFAHEQAENYLTEQTSAEKYAKQAVVLTAEVFEYEEQACDVGSRANKQLEALENDMLERSRQALADKSIQIHALRSQVGLLQTELDSTQRARFEDVELAQMEEEQLIVESRKVFEEMEVERGDQLQQRLSLETELLSQKDLVGMLQDEILAKAASNSAELNRDKISSTHEELRICREQLATKEQQLGILEEEVLSSRDAERVVHKRQIIAMQADFNRRLREMQASQSKQSQLHNEQVEQLQSDLLHKASEVDHLHAELRQESGTLKQHSVLAEESEDEIHTSEEIREAHAEALLSMQKELAPLQDDLYAHQELLAAMRRTLDDERKVREDNQTAHSEQIEAYRMQLLKLSSDADQQLMAAHLEIKEQAARFEADIRRRIIDFEVERLNSQKKVDHLEAQLRGKSEAVEMPSANLARNNEEVHSSPTCKDFAGIVPSELSLEVVERPPVQRCRSLRSSSPTSSSSKSLRSRQQESRQRRQVPAASSDDDSVDSVQGSPPRLALSWSAYVEQADTSPPPGRRLEWDMS